MPSVSSDLKEKQATMFSLNSRSMLRVSLPLAVTTLAALGSGPATAAPSCTLTSFDSTIDFGEMRLSGNEKDIKPDPLRRTFVAACSEAAQMNLVFNAPAKGASTMQFGDKGAYGAHVVSARLDGDMVQMARLQAAGASPSEAPSGDLTLLPSDVFAPAVGQRLLSGQRLEITLEIAPQIPADAVRINQQVKLNATAQLQLIAR
jgi:hypothetical protein